MHGGNPLEKELVLVETADNYRVETADNYRNPDERSAGHGCDPLTSVSGNPCRSAD